MITPDLLKYVETELAKGTPKDIIQSTLVNGGWNTNDITEGFSALTIQNIKVPPIAPPQNISQIQPQIQIHLNEPIIQQAVNTAPINITHLDTTSLSKQKSNSGKTIFAVIILLLILSGSAYAYINKDNLIIPIIKSTLVNLGLSKVVVKTNTAIQKTTGSTSEQVIATTTDEQATATANIIQKNTSTSNISSSSLKTFTSKNGAISFKYPSNMFATSSESSMEILITSKKIPKDTSDVVCQINFVNAAEINNYYNNGLLLKTTTANGYKVYTVKNNSSNSLSYISESYLITYEMNSNPKYYMQFSLIPDTKGITYNDIVPILNSLLIDTIKIDTFIENATGVARNKGIDAAIKSGLANMRAQAEIYYDGNNMSYLNVCTSNKTNYGLSEMIDSTKKMSGLNIFCSDSKIGWAASSQLKDSTGWCVDSTGYSGVSTPIAGQTGKCK
jgi:hypothetical protein